MISEFNRRKLRFMILPTRFYPRDHHAEALLAFECWKSVWGVAFAQEMNVSDKLYSDFYTKQSHVAVLFHGEQVLGLTTLNIFDLTNPIALEDTFFKVWPENALINLQSFSSSVLACCNVTLDFKFRKNALGISGKDLLMAMQFQYLKYTQHDSIVAAVRLEKGMEKSSYRTGAIALAEDLPYTIEGQRVDIVCWKRDLNLNLWDPEILELSNYIWKNSSKIVGVDKQGDTYAA